MKRIINSLINNYLPAKNRLSFALLLVLTTLIFGLPHLLIPKLLGPNKPYYSLVLYNAPVFTADRTVWFGAQTREVLDGRPFETDSLVYENKDKVSVAPFITVWIIALLTKLSGSINMGFISLDFIVPPLLFFLIYLFAYRLTRSYLFSIFTSTLILYGNQLFQFFPPISPNLIRSLAYLILDYNKEPSPLEYSRIANPLLAFPFLVLAFLSLHYSMNHKKITPSIISGILGGLLFYVYLYYWTFFFAGVFLLLIFYLLKNNHTTYRRLLITIFFAGLVSIFYWINFFALNALPQRQEILLRGGLEFGRIRNQIRTLQYLIFVGVFWFLSKKKTQEFYFLLAFLIAGIGLMNMQLITGYNFQSFHWTIRVLNPMSAIMITYLLSQFSRTNHIIWKRTIHFATSIAIFLLFAYGLYNQLSFSIKTYSAYTLPQEKIDSYRWLNQNTPIDSVVASPIYETNVLLPTYTHNNIFSPHGSLTLASNQEIIERFYITAKLFNLSPQHLNDIFSSKVGAELSHLDNCLNNKCILNRKPEFLEHEGAFNYFNLYYLNKSEGLSQWFFDITIPELEKNKLIKDYQEYLESDELVPAKYKLDYLYYGPEERKVSNVNFENYNFLSKVYDNGKVAIYKLQNGSK